MTPYTGKTLEHISRSRKGKRVICRIGWAVLALVILLVLIVLASVVYQGIASAVDVGGYRLHLYCTGSGSPTVILDAGNGGSSLDWSLVQPGVANFTQVCSYDRAGYGWSDSGPTPRSSGRIVRELHTLLVNAGIPGPYVLVGQSFGGLNMRLYAYTYPQDVAGLVLVDSSHEDDPAARQAILAGQQQLSMCQHFAPFGVIRLLGSLNQFISPYPAGVQAVLKAHLDQTRFCGTWYDESAAWVESISQVRTARKEYSLGHLPLVVITHGKDLDASWKALQNDLASLSSNSTHLIATRSGHAIMFDQPDLVIAAIRQIVTESSTLDILSERPQWHRAKGNSLPACYTRREDVQ
jgi:pimeloyl-ACP methyl ester carboxylesterase